MGSSMAKSIKSPDCAVTPISAAAAVQPAATKMTTPVMKMAPSARASASAMSMQPVSAVRAAKRIAPSLALSTWASAITPASGPPARAKVSPSTVVMAEKRSTVRVIRSRVLPIGTAA